MLQKKQKWNQQGTGQQENASEIILLYHNLSHPHRAETAVGF